MSSFYCHNLERLRPEFLHTFLFVGFVFDYLKYVCWWGRSGQDVDPSLSKMSASGSIANGELAYREDSKGGSVEELLPTSL